MPPQTPSDQLYPEPDRSDETRFSEAQAERLNQERPAPEPPRSPVSRRSVLRGVAGAGVVGVAAAAGVGAAIEFDRQPAQATSLKPVSKPVAMAPMPPSAADGPLVVYIADATAGLMDVFGGTGATRVDNPSWSGQLLANLKLA